MTTGGTHDRYRADARRTFQSMSNEALAYQAGVVRGGIDLQELERELERRGAHARLVVPQRELGSCPVHDADEVGEAAEARQELNEHLERTSSGGRFGIYAGHAGYGIRDRRTGEFVFDALELEPARALARRLETGETRRVRVQMDASDPSSLSPPTALVGWHVLDVEWFTPCVMIVGERDAVASFIGDHWGHAETFGHGAYAELYAADPDAAVDRWLADGEARICRHCTNVVEPEFELCDSCETQASYDRASSPTVELEPAEAAFVVDALDYLAGVDEGENTARERLLETARAIEYRLAIARAGAHGVDVELERFDPAAVNLMIDELEALPVEARPAAVRACNDGSSVSDWQAYADEVPA